MFGRPRTEAEKGGHGSRKMAWASILTSFLVVACAAAATVEETVSLDWRNLTFVAGSKRILDGVGGGAAPGRLLAIMGPSGSGKTTLLNSLAGQLKAGKATSLSGTLRINGEQAGGASDVAGLRVAYVRQEDVFYTQSELRVKVRVRVRVRGGRRLLYTQSELRLGLGLELGSAGGRLLNAVCARPRANPSLSPSRQASPKRRANVVTR